MTRREAVEVAVLACGTAGVLAYTAFFAWFATHTFCLFAVPPWDYYLPQYVVAVVFLLAGSLAVVRATALLRTAYSAALAAPSVAFAVAAFLAAGVRLFFVVGNMSMCFYPP